MDREKARTCAHKEKDEITNASQHYNNQENKRYEKLDNGKVRSSRINRSRQRYPTNSIINIEEKENRDMKRKQDTNPPPFLFCTHTKMHHQSSFFTTL